MAHALGNAPLHWRRAAILVAIVVSAGWHGQVALAKGSSPSYGSYQSNPAGSFWFTVDQSAAKAFIDGFQRFAAQKGFKFWKSIVSPNERNFSITLQGEGLQIVSVNDAEVFQIYFYLARENPASAATISAWTRDFKADLGQVPGVRFPDPSNRPLRRWER